MISSLVGLGNLKRDGDLLEEVVVAVITGSGSLEGWEVRLWMHSERMLKGKKDMVWLEAGLSRYWTLVVKWLTRPAKGISIDVGRLQIVSKYL